MKSKIYLLGFLVVCILFTFDSCKSKESAYKAAYEAAKQKELADEDTQDVTPAEKPKATYSTPSSSTATVQKERVTVVDEPSSTIQQYSVVVGSFINKTNANSLKERMQGKGYQAFLAQNEKGMYRVIVATFSNRASAANARDNIKEKFYPDFQDAWLLDKN